MNTQNKSILTDLYKGLVWNPVDHVVYLDNPSIPAESIRYDTPVLDSRAWTEQVRNKAASAVAVGSDPLALTDVFFGEYAELANEMLQEMHLSRQQRDRQRAASVVTSQHYTVLQDAIILGESTDAIKTGVLAGLFDDVAVPTLNGKWIDYTTGVDYETNVPEGVAVEPTRGTATSTTYTLPKHMGGVAITERAEAIINGDNIFARLVNELSRKRLYAENGLVATELETATTVAGVDFGERSGTVPFTSTKDPLNGILLTVADTLDSNNGTLTGLASKNQVWFEYITNDYIKGINTANPSITPNESVGPAPGLPGVTWFRDNAISAATKLWAVDRSKGGKNFRGPVRSFQVMDPKTETTEQFLKSYFLCEIVDTGLVREITGVTA